MEIDTARFPLSHRPGGGIHLPRKRYNLLKDHSQPLIFTLFEMKRFAWPYHHVEAGPM